MGVAYVKGLQGDDLSKGVIATAKHFAAYSASEGGRNCAPVRIGERELREVYLYPFEAAVKVAKVMSIMSAYHDIDGVPCTASRKLLTEILRNEWGFEGFVVSDYGAIGMLKSFHFIAKDLKDAAIKAIKAGVDVELPSIACYGEPLLSAVKEGLIPMEVIDKAVARVLYVKFRLSLFENPYVDVEKVPEILDSEDDRKLALELARKSIVLLKNDGILPLRNVKTIALAGPNADDPRNLLGDYTYTGHHDLEKPAVKVVTVLEGLRSRAPAGVKILNARGCGIVERDEAELRRAVEVASQADVVIAVMGERSGLSPRAITGEGRDRALLSLPEAQEELLEELIELGKPIVLVLVNGRPLNIEKFVDKVNAIIEAWFPGEEGGNAIADILLGSYCPGGKLPITWPRSEGQLPLYYSMKPSSFKDYVFKSIEPLFPFGHGLSYTKFRYDKLRIEPERVEVGGEARISLEVENIGDVEGDEVVQLYVRPLVASVTRPMKELKGFKRISLKPKEKVMVEFIIHTEQLAFYDENMRLIIEPSTYEIMVGSSSEDVRLRGILELHGRPMVVKRKKKFFTKVRLIKSS